MEAHRHPTFLIWGRHGWIAGLLLELLQREGRKVYTTAARLEDRQAVLAALEQYQPSHVLNCAGVTGRPNVDWCEDNKQDTFRSNLIGFSTLADCCYLRGVHCTMFATGCKSSFPSQACGSSVAIQLLITAKAFTLTMSDIPCTALQASRRPILRTFPVRITLSSKLKRRALSCLRTPRTL